MWPQVSTTMLPLVIRVASMSRTWSTPAGGPPGSVRALPSASVQTLTRCSWRFTSANASGALPAALAYQLIVAPPQAVFYRAWAAVFARVSAAASDSAGGAGSVEGAGEGAAPTVAAPAEDFDRFGVEVVGLAGPAPAAAAGAGFAGAFPTGAAVWPPVVVVLEGRGAGALGLTPFFTWRGAVRCASLPLRTLSSCARPSSLFFSVGSSRAAARPASSSLTMTGLQSALSSPHGATSPNSRTSRSASASFASS